MAVAVVVAVVVVVVAVVAVADAAPEPQGDRSLNALYLSRSSLMDQLISSRGDTRQQMYTTRTLTEPWRQSRFCRQQPVETTWTAYLDHLSQHAGIQPRGSRIPYRPAQYISQDVRGYTLGNYCGPEWGEVGGDRGRGAGLTKSMSL